jgi:hypothetical protein
VFGIGTMNIEGEWVSENRRIAVDGDNRDPNKFASVDSDPAGGKWSTHPPLDEGNRWNQSNSFVNGTRY